MSTTVGTKIIGVVYADREEAETYASRLLGELRLGASSWVCPVRQIDQAGTQMARTSLVVTIGGDGTILRTARAAAPYEVPVVGINLGRLGFMTELRADEASERLAWYLDGDGAWVDKRTMLQATLTRPGGAEVVHHGLNDVVVARGAAPRMLHLDANLSGTPLTTYYADALIVATATGSTGYSLAAGGPILHGGSSDVLVMPVAPHVSLRTPLVLPPDVVITLSVKTETSAQVSVDGLEGMPVAPQDTVTVQRSPYTARFLRARDPKYFYSTLIHRLGLIPGAWTVRIPEDRGHS